MQKHYAHLQDTVAVKLPPALSPTIASLDAFIIIVDSCSIVHLRAAKHSSSAVGYRTAGLNEYSTKTTAACARAVN